MSDYLFMEPLESRELLAATHLRINCGGGAFVSGSGKSWQGDRGFSGGSSSSALFAVGNTTDDALFAAHRSGTFGYSLAVANGNYKLKLLFVEPSAGAGTRTFDVSAEHKQIFSNVDIARAVGTKNALVRAAMVTVKDGRLSLWFQANKGDAIVSAIECVPAPLPWQQKAALPLGRYEAMGAGVNGKLYEFGGFYTTSIKTTKRADVYDPANNTWTRIADVPELLSHSGTATDGRFVYLAGGFVGNWVGDKTPVTKHVWRYDTQSDKWTAILSLPAGRGAGALVRVGRKLHFFGGVDSGIRDSASHWVLDLRTLHKWLPAAALPDPRNHLGYTDLNGKIYAVGGQHRLEEITGNVTSVHEYDPATNQWRALRGLPVARSHTHNATLVWNGRLTIVGGSTASGSVADVTQYNPTKGRWVTLGYLPAVRSAEVARLVGSQMIVVGGSSTGVDPNTNTWVLG